jgi:ATP-dependent helicase HrpA
VARRPGESNDPGGTRVEAAGWRAADFASALERAKADLRGFVPRFVDLLREILEARQKLLVLTKPPPWLERELGALLPRDFLRATPHPQLAHFPRYLKALALRAERWRQNPIKDAERAAGLAPYLAALERLRTGRTVPLPGAGRGKAPVAASGRAGADAKPDGGGPSRDADREAFRWLVEEFRVSLFAQELGTAVPVSAVKLDRALAAMEGDRPGQREAPAPALRPIVAAPLAEKKAKPLKNLGALDRLFPR